MFKSIILLLIVYVFAKVQAKTQFCATIDKDETGGNSGYVALQGYSSIYISI